jgi:hypothetical protein
MGNAVEQGFQSKKKECSEPTNATQKKENTTSIMSESSSW